jgi:hypothetical protein
MSAPLHRPCAASMPWLKSMRTTDSRHSGRGSSIIPATDAQRRKDKGNKSMNKTVAGPPSEAEIFRRILDVGGPFFSAEAARGIMRLKFSGVDRERMNELAARNREGRVSPAEEQELSNYIRVGQILGILQSKARRSLQTHGQTPTKKRRKS